MLKNYLYFVFLLCFSISQNANAQFSIPYYNAFDKAGDTLGWRHYASSGTDDWELGKPNKFNFKSAFSFPNAWSTKLSGSANQSSDRSLETPYFNLKDTSGKLVLSFLHMRQYYGNGVRYYLEYSINKGNSWNLLNDANAKKKNWQGTSGFYNNTSSFENSVHCIKFLQGKDSVKFRFRYISDNNYSEGWMIDNFQIAKEYFNFFATAAEPIHVAQKCSDFTLKTSLGFDNQYTDYYTNTSKYYFSKDSLLDNSDSLLGTRVISTTTSIDNWDQNFGIKSGLRTGKYYILFKHDALDILKEASETDNIGYAILYVDSVYGLPYSDDFESNSNRQWRGYTYYNTTKLVWEKGSGTRHHIDGAHSGSFAWHTGKSSELDVYNCGNNCFLQYLESPYFDFSSDTLNGLAINFWYKAYLEANAINIQYSSDCGNSWNLLTSFNSARNDDWDFINLNTNSFAGMPSVVFRVSFSTSYIAPEGVVFDDFYIGPRLPDLSIEKDVLDRFTPSNNAADTLTYFYHNSGMHISLGFTQQTTTQFYWSNDSLLDMGDIYLGANTEAAILDSSGRWNKFAYTKPNLNPGKYYIIYKLDASSLVDEMRESNNIGCMRLYQTTPYTIPYSNTFETQTNNWRHNSSLGKDKWTCATPKGLWKEKAFSGSKAWLSSDSGYLAPMSRSHLYTPIFDLRNTLHPVMEFDMVNWGDGSCNCHEAKMNMSYSIDGGANWIVLDTANASYNRWYYPMDYDGGRDKNYYLANYSEILFNVAEPAFSLVNQYNSRDARRNTRFILDISALSGKAKVQFRFNIATARTSPTDSVVKAALIDNFSIRNGFTDLMLDYKKPLMLSSNAKQVKFFMEVKNNGNYFSKQGIIKFYLSANTTLDSSDFVLGQTTLAVVRPDLYSYINVNYSAPQNLKAYKYLLYFLDATYTTLESNEANNVSYWDLAIDSAVQLPYINGFSDTIQVGWHQYSIGPYSNDIGDYRFRNLLTPAEYLYQTAMHTEEFFTDRMLSGSWNTPPMVYLETPPFNFKNDDSILMSFDLMCTGTGNDGGTMRYSIDGGNVWIALKDVYGTGKKWFNNYSMSELQNDPGWSKPAAQIGLNPNDSTFIDISYLKGKEDVRFQFAYKSNYEALGSGTPQGMRLDNFIVEGTDIDFIADPTKKIKNLAVGSKTIDLAYTIECLGSSTGRESLTKFYWSLDSIFDSGDSLILNKNEIWIKTGTKISTQASITIPDLDTQLVYYLFYMLDGDFKLNETSETNNLGTCKLQFNKSANYLSMDKFAMLNAKINEPFVQVKYKIKNNGKIDGNISETQFYWSADSLLDNGDTKIKALYQGVIKAGDSVSSKVKIQYPTPINKAVYYLFYLADNKDSILESNENDNLGTYKIMFNYGSDIHSIETNKIQLYARGKSLVLDIKENTVGTSFHLEVYNSLAQVLVQDTYACEPGINVIELGQGISQGYYFVRLELDGQVYSGLFFLE